MNALIKQTLEDHATDCPTPHVDVAALEATGRARVRRRRVAGGVGALVLVAAVGVGTPYLVAGVGDDAQQGQVAVDGGSATSGQVSWSVGTTVHVGDTTVELPQVPRAYVLVDDGIVWTDAEQGVNLTRLGADGRTEQIGVSTVPYGRVLVAEGSLAAWYDGNEQAFTVVDTSTGELVRQVPVVLDGPQDGEFDGPTVRSLDQGVLWFYADRESSGVDARTGRTVGTVSATGNTLPSDVRDGFLVLEDRGLKLKVLRIAGPVAGTVPGDGRALLSPDGRYVATDPNDSEQVWDVATGADVTPDFGYDFQAVVRWLDDDRYQALAIDIDEGSNGEQDGPIDFLVCSVSGGDCEVVADDAVTPQDEAFAVPVGESFE